MAAIKRGAYTIGSVAISAPTALAPMEGITERGFRTLIRSLGGCGLAVTEFVSSESLTRDVARAWQTAEIDPSEHPIAIQIYGRDPERMGDAARMCQDLGADIVDINLGCPSKAVTSGCAGSALMRDPERAQQIFRAVGKAVERPFTVKMRLGWDQSSKNAAQIAVMAQGEGAQQVVVHGRTRADAYGGVADWRAVAEVKAAVEVPVLVNGDILTAQDAVRALEESGADGVMVGRGVLRNPWLLMQISQILANEPLVRPSLDDRLAVLLRYITGQEERFDGNFKAVLSQVKRVTGYFTRGVPRSAQARDALYRSTSLGEAKAALEGFFEELKAAALEDAFDTVAAHEVDPRLRLGDSRSLQRGLSE
jgi:tRNA-dihydrouridine synthase B